MPPGITWKTLQPQGWLPGGPENLMGNIDSNDPPDQDMLAELQRRIQRDREFKAQLAAQLAAMKF
jgi:hypothetical protein